MFSFKARTTDGGVDDKQFALLVAYLIISSACCIAAGIIGLVKTITLENYKKETGLG